MSKIEFTDKFAETVYMMFCGDMDTWDVADILGAPEHVVLAALQRGRKLYREKHFGTNEGDDGLGDSRELAGVLH